MQEIHLKFVFKLQTAQLSTKHFAEPELADDDVGELAEVAEDVAEEVADEVAEEVAEDVVEEVADEVAEDVLELCCKVEFRKIIVNIIVRNSLLFMLRSFYGVIFVLCIVSVLFI